jgi:hypothetical protein
MPSSHGAIDQDACPVGDDLLGNLYRASEHGLAELVETVSGDVRAMLALFCYRRAHLHSMSLAIAATCSERDLIDQGGMVGSTLFAMSREAPSEAIASGHGNRRAISLSTKPLSPTPVMMDEIDDEPDSLTA